MVSVSSRLSAVCRLFAVIFAFGALLIACPGHPEDWEAEPENAALATYLAHLDSLTQLGVTTTETPASDPMGNALPDGYNPLGAARLYSTDTTYGYSGAAPYGGRTSVLAVKEIYLSGVDFGNGFLDEIYEDFQSGWPAANFQANSALRSIQGGKTGSFIKAPLFSETQDADDWLSRPKKSIAGNFAGDGFDSVMTAVVYMETGEIAIRIGNSNSDTGATAEVFRFKYPGGTEALNAALPETAISWGTGRMDELRYAGIDMAVGDIDADGFDEALLAVGGEVFIVEITAKTAVSASTVNVTVDAASVSSYNTGGGPVIVRLACADYNQDGCFDWVETVTHISGDAPVYTIYNGYTWTAFSRPYASGSVKIPGDGRLLRSANVTTGDFDGDGLPETAFCGKASDSDNYLLFILDTEMDSGSQPVFSFLNSVTDIVCGGNNTPGKGAVIPALLSCDMDGDWYEEVFAVSKLFVLNGTGSAAEVWSHPAGNSILFDAAYSGDVDGDFCDDILYYDWEKRLSALTMDDGGQILVKTLSGKAAGAFAALALSNSDTADGLVLQYIGHYMAFSKPVVLAVLASPPYYGDITYSSPVIFHSTTYGQSDETGSGSTAGINFQASAFGLLSYRSGLIDSEDLRNNDQVGAQLAPNPPGAGAMDGINIAIEEALDGFLYVSRRPSVRSSAAPLYNNKFSFIQNAADGYLSAEEEHKGGTMTLSGGKRWGSGHSSQVSTNISYSSPAGSDTVLFTCVPYDIYEYKVLSSTAGSSYKEGDFYSEPYPRESGTYSVSLEYYNAHNNDSPDVSVPHTVGDPFSYLTLTQMAIIKAKAEGKGVYTSASQVLTGRSNLSWTSQSVSELTSTEKNTDWSAGVRVGLYFYASEFNKKKTSPNYAKGDVEDTNAGQQTGNLETGNQAVTETGNIEQASRVYPKAAYEFGPVTSEPPPYTSQPFTGAERVPVYTGLEDANAAAQSVPLQIMDATEAPGGLNTLDAFAAYSGTMVISVRAGSSALTPFYDSESIDVFDAGEGGVGATLDVTKETSAYTSISDGLFISGQVPDVPISALDHPLFKWGLLLYPYYDSQTGLSFNYITYWVESAERGEYGEGEKAVGR